MNINILLRERRYTETKTYCITHLFVIKNKQINLKKKSKNNPQCYKLEKRFPLERMKLVVITVIQ